jgi:hypothetical protein
MNIRENVYKRDIYNLEQLRLTTENEKLKLQNQINENEKQIKNNNTEFNKK